MIVNGLQWKERVGVSRIDSPVKMEQMLSLRDVRGTPPIDGLEYCLEELLKIEYTCM